MAGQNSILVINAGSSSIKFAIYGRDLARSLSGQFEGIGSKLHLTATTADGAILADRHLPGGESLAISEIISELMQFLENHIDGGMVSAVGHRVAVGGLTHSRPVVVTTELMDKLDKLVPLAPLHLPRNLEPIASLMRLYPGIPQVACFDTEFHRTQPRVAEQYGLPRGISDAGAHRYGFHGLSYEYVSGQLAGIDDRAARGRTIVAHLGSGASMCALSAGRSIATTMGFSPLSGIVMATRPGDLDPGLMIWLLRERGMSVDEVEQMLYRESGLKGVSGISGDMRELLASEDSRAREAIDLFVYRICQQTGALTAALGGLDALVFTAGIGEHSPEIRKAVCERSTWLGIGIDDTANANNELVINSDESAVSVYVIPTNEELVIAGHVRSLLQLS